MVLQQVLTLKWQPCSRTNFLVFLPAKIATTSFPAVDPIGSPLISDSIEFTPEVVYSKIMNLHNSKNPRPDGWPIPIIQSVSELIAIPLSIIFKKS